MLAASLIAAGQGSARPVLAFDAPILLPGLYLAGALLVGALIIAAASHWRRRGTSPAVGPSDQMAHFRSLYEQGAISEEEFSRLRSLLGGELRWVLDVPPRPQPPAAGMPAPGGQGGAVQ